MAFVAFIGGLRRVAAAPSLLLGAYGVALAVVLGMQLISGGMAAAQPRSAAAAGALAGIPHTFGPGLVGFAAVLSTLGDLYGQRAPFGAATGIRSRHWNGRRRRSRLDVSGRRYSRPAGPTAGDGRIGFLRGLPAPFLAAGAPRGPGRRPVLVRRKDGKLAHRSCWAGCIRGSSVTFSARRRACRPCRLTAHRSGPRST